MLLFYSKNTWKLNTTVCLLKYTASLSFQSMWNSTQNWCLICPNQFQNSHTKSEQEISCSCLVKYSYEISPHYILHQIIVNVNKLKKALYHAEYSIYNRVCSIERNLINIFRLLLVTFPGYSLPGRGFCSYIIYWWRWFSHCVIWNAHSHNDGYSIHQLDSAGIFVFFFTNWSILYILFISYFNALFKVRDVITHLVRWLFSNFEMYKIIF